MTWSLKILLSRCEMIRTGIKGPSFCNRDLCVLIVYVLFDMIFIHSAGLHYHMNRFLNARRFSVFSLESWQPRVIVIKYNLTPYYQMLSTDFNYHMTYINKYRSKDGPCGYYERVVNKLCCIM